MEDDSLDDDLDWACPDCGAPDPQPIPDGYRCTECEWVSTDEV